MTWLDCDQAQAEAAYAEWLRTDADVPVHPDETGPATDILRAAFVAGAQWQSTLRGDD